jgi:phosphohistidine phosphatase SixA
MFASWRSVCSAACGADLALRRTWHGRPSGPAAPWRCYGTRAPGTSDPPAFELGDCATQRNLSSEGREQARRIGAQFVANGIVVGRVLSSEWCRCLETARIASAHPIEPFPPLNSFFANQDVGGTQTRAVRELIDGWRSQPGVLVLVTHQVNITALTGVFPAEGEVVVLKPKAPSGFDVMARLKP